MSLEVKEYWKIKEFEDKLAAIDDVGALLKMEALLKKLLVRVWDRRSLIEFKQDKREKE